MLLKIYVESSTTGEQTTSLNVRVTTFYRYLVVINCSYSYSPPTAALDTPLLSCQLPIRFIRLGSTMARGYPTAMAP